MVKEHLNLSKAGIYK